MKSRSLNRKGEKGKPGNNMPGHHMQGLRETTTGGKGDYEGEEIRKPVVQYIYIYKRWV